MSNYKERQKQHQVKFILTSKLEGDGTYRGKVYPYILKEGAANLYSPIREGALQYFRENKIQWWGGKMPTGNTLSSQVMCVNHLFPVARDKEAVLSIVNGIRGGFTAILPILCDKSPQYISFEVVSDKDHLNEVSKKDHLNERVVTRGKQCTSVDALILAQHESGRVILILIEWKYTEVYYNSDKSAEVVDGHNRGQERQRRYNDLIGRSEQLKSVPSCQGSVYYQEPYYQLMRQTLWAEQMVANKQTERIKADDYLHLHVIPKDNDALLKKKYKASDTDMETTWRKMLSDSSKYLIVSPEELLKPIIRDQKYPDLVKYLEQRYWDLKYRTVDRIRGSLIAGAAGDALGYTVEFISRSSILSRYGARGITEFELSSEGKALVSDDTQMTLFTANGMLMGITRGAMRGVGGKPEDYVDGAYLDWYYTQTGRKKEMLTHYTWLRDLPELAHCRAPGNTCMSACESLLQGEKVSNNSKGCGGIMRVAPMALLMAGYWSRGKSFYDVASMDEAGAKIAAVTHKHPLAFLPAAMLTHFIYRLIRMDEHEIKTRIAEIALETIGALDTIYKGEYTEDKHYLAELTREAVTLATGNRSDVENILRLGEGWTGEEAWAIALYCAVRHVDSAKEAIIAAVNHDGDSDSTGAVCGNIMGAIYGYEAIKRQRLFCPKDKEIEQTLELSNIILAIADDLYTCSGIDEFAPDTPENRQWYERYCGMKPAGI